MNDVWQLIAKPHRVFYFLHSAGQKFLLLNAFRKRSQKTPPREIDRAERLRGEYLRSVRQGER